jgi:hypothetical protein
MAHALFPRPLAHETCNRAEVDSVLEEDQAAGAKAKLPKLGQEAFRSGYSGYFSGKPAVNWRNQGTSLRTRSISVKAVAHV